MVETKNSIEKLEGVNFCILLRHLLCFEIVEEQETNNGLVDRLGVRGEKRQRV
uniref:Bm14373 n=1 Tax=Brugia malayi TaxID=6279 RepID=A0A1I9FZY6_BRUMA|nr:Bm14373 [Brugia malayi]